MESSHSRGGVGFGKSRKKEENTVNLRQPLKDNDRQGKKKGV